MAEKRGRMIFDLSDEDRETLERIRVARGLRSHAETLRAMIRTAEVASRISGLLEASRVPAAPLTPAELRLEKLLAIPAAKRTAGRNAKIKAARAVASEERRAVYEASREDASRETSGVAIMQRKSFNPQPKKGKK